jgi:hypothetical protein
MSNLTELYTSLKRNPDNTFYVDLVKLLEFRLATVKDQLIKAVDTDEMKRLQGRGAELSDMLSALQRKPVKAQHTGSFN